MKIIKDLLIDQYGEICAAPDLGGAEEFLIRGNGQSLLKAIGENEKREFIMVINSRK